MFWKVKVYSAPIRVGSEPIWKEVFFPACSLTKRDRHRTVEIGERLVEREERRSHGGQIVSACLDEELEHAVCLLNPDLAVAQGGVGGVIAFDVILMSPYPENSAIPLIEILPKVAGGSIDIGPVTDGVGSAVGAAGAGAGAGVAAGVCAAGAPALFSCRGGAGA